MADLVDAEEDLLPADAAVGRELVDAGQVVELVVAVGVVKSAARAMWADWLDMLESGS